MPATSTEPSERRRLERLVDRWATDPGRAVIFDFNGTLSDDEGTLCRLYVELFDEVLGWKISEEEYLERFAGKSDREIVAEAVAATTAGSARLVEALLCQRRERYAEIVTTSSPVTSGAAELVRWLRSGGIPLGIVTGAQRADVRLVLEGSKLSDAFGALVTEEDVERGKPDPEGFLLGASRLGVTPSAVVVFEDSLFGVRAARSAGMSCIAVQGTGRVEALPAEADALVGSLSAGIFSVGHPRPPDAQQGG